MPPDIPEKEPTIIEAGTTVKWTKDLSDSYPADDGWSLGYTFIHSTAKFTVTATASGTKFSVTVPAATTAAYTIGTYSWIARVSKAGEVFTVDKGTCVVKTNIDAATTFDHRTHVKKVLDAIEAVLESRASKDQMGYSIEGRQLSRTPIPDLLVLRDKYKVEYQNEMIAEKIANGENTGRKIKVRF